VNKQLSKGFSWERITSTRIRLTTPRSERDLAAGGAELARPAGEEGNSSFDIRHQVSGTYLYELPFGKDKFWVTSGVGSHILEGFSVSGSFTFATGSPLTPSYTATENDVEADSGIGRRIACRELQWRGPRVALVQPGGVCCACDGSGLSVRCVWQLRRGTRSPGREPSRITCRWSKTVQMGDTRSMEIRATLNNAFNTVQYAGVGTSVTLPTFGQVTSVGKMRWFEFRARFRF